jgi:hypothetical protein
MIISHYHRDKRKSPEYHAPQKHPLHTFEQNLVPPATAPFGRAGRNTAVHEKTFFLPN